MVSLGKKKGSNLIPELLVNNIYIEKTKQISDYFNSYFCTIHRRNNHWDRGRQVPPPILGLGDLQCIGPPQLFGRMQLLISASPENILAQLNESAATPSPGCSACTQGQTIQH